MRDKLCSFSSASASPIAEWTIGIIETLSDMGNGYDCGVDVVVWLYQRLAWHVPWRQVKRATEDDGVRAWLYGFLLAHATDESLHIRFPTLEGLLAETGDANT